MRCSCGTSCRQPLCVGVRSCTTTCSRASRPPTAILDIRRAGGRDLQREGHRGGPHYAPRGDIVTVHDPEIGPVKQPATLPKLSRTPGHVYTAAPLLGEHNRDSYGGVLGKSDAELAELASAGDHLACDSRAQDAQLEPTCRIVSRWSRVRVSPLLPTNTRNGRPMGARSGVSGDRASLDSRPTGRLLLMQPHRR